MAHRLQGKHYAALVDLACARVAATGIVSNLHFADPRQTGRYPPDQVTLSDLGVIEVQADAQLRAVDDREERQNGLGCARAFSNYVCKPVHLMTCINAISRQACGKVMYVP